MTETAQTRSRRASLAGLILQIIAYAGLLALSFVTRSQAMYHLAWFVFGGIPIWFVTLLVFRQRELAALEAMDLEELRREKQATGGGEALFDEEGGMGLGFRVAEARLNWMLRWLLPGFSLATVLYLAAAGIYLWQMLMSAGLRVSTGPWPEMTHIPVSMVIVAIIMVGTVLFSRYASGMGRVPEWQLLRGCGAYMLGNALAMIALLITLGVQQYVKQPAWEHTLAFIIPALMVVLAIEILINFVLDIYRPRAPGTEPRAAFDSRLLGLIAEPGGIASSIAEALNYQFGFQVSQTWFYKLLERAALPLILVGTFVLWSLTTIVVIQPYEHVIVERFGRQLNADDPLGPGIHLKLPWPIDVARTYNTGKLNELHVGYEIYDAQIRYADEDEGRDRDILLWTDATHFGLEHFDFLICPQRQPGDEPEDAGVPSRFTAGEQRVDKQPVHLLRMDVAIQYRLVPEKLDQITQYMANPQRFLLNVAWEEIGRVNAASTADYLMGPGISELGEKIRRRINDRIAKVGLEVVYVGFTNVHPEKTVAQAYRNIVRAEMEKVAAIREARVTENQTLSEVAGEAAHARGLAATISRANEATKEVNITADRLTTIPDQTRAQLIDRLLQHADRFRAAIRTAADLHDTRQHYLRVQREFELGLSRTFAEQLRAAEQVTEVQAEADQASQALESALQPLRNELSTELGANADLVDTLIAHVRARVAEQLWTDRLNSDFALAELGGRAAATLSRALAERWQIEMGAASELARARNERAAYRAAPRVYKARRLMDVIIEGIQDSRKFFLAFNPGDRLVRVRFVAEDEPQTDIFELSPEQLEQQ